MRTGLHEVLYTTMGTSACSIITGRDTESPEHSGDQLVHCHYLDSECTKYLVYSFMLLKVHSTNFTKSVYSSWGEQLYDVFCGSGGENNSDDVVMSSGSSKLGRFHAREGIIDTIGFIMGNVGSRVFSVKLCSFDIFFIHLSQVPPTCNTKLLDSSFLTTESCRFQNDMKLMHSSNSEKCPQKFVRSVVKI